MIPRNVLRVLVVLGALYSPLISGFGADAFAAPAFAQRWQQDEQVVVNFWGPLADAYPGQYEPYGNGDVCRPPRLCTAAIPDSSSGRRLVQYFDKGRMELGMPPGGVTAGLLVREMVTGQLQLGDSQFEQRTPAAITVAGDSANPFPLYRDLAAGPVVSMHVPIGAPVTLLLTAHGADVITQPQDARTAVVLADTATGHGLPLVFADFRTRVGLDTVGYALTDPFWADVAIGGAVQRILVQAFERRVLTFNPTNPAPYQVEFGNVGRQYYQWRYGDAS